MGRFCDIRFLLRDVSSSGLTTQGCDAAGTSIFIDTGALEPIVNGRTMRQMLRCLQRLVRGAVVDADGLVIDLETCTVR